VVDRAGGEKGALVWDGVGVTMLSQYERRQLEGIEQALAEEDPKLAAILRIGVLDRYRWLFAVLGAFGMACLVLGCVVANVVLILSGVAFATAGFGLCLRR